MFRFAAVIAAFFTIAVPVLAGPEAFKPGAVVPDYGSSASVPGTEFPADTRFKVAFDVAEAGPDGDANPKLVSAARFLNMHAAAGVPVENMSLAVVVHGGAWKDLLTDEARGGTNPNARLIAELVAVGTTLELCGQTAAMRDVAQEDLLPGVTIALSAMTAHALLQQQGYTLNPF